MSRPDVELQCLFRRIFFVTKVAQQSFCLVDGFHVLGHFPPVRESDVTLGATRPASYQVRLQNVFLERFNHANFILKPEIPNCFVYPDKEQLSNEIFRH